MRAEDAVKDFWATRPRRPRRGRKIAGVAAGIANRYRIDPVLVRVGLVVATLYGGAGFVLYLLGWLFLPEQDDEVSPIESVLGKGRSSTSAGFTVLLCIALVPVLGWFFGSSPIGAFPAWLSLVVVGGLLFLLHQNRGHLGPVTPAPAAPPAPPPTVSFDVPPAGAPVEPAPTEPHEEVRTAPPAWDPLGAAPFAWDLPDPTPPEPDEPEPPVKRRKPRVATATIGVALVVAAGMSFAMGGWITPQHIVGVVLAVLGLGMVAGAFLRAGRGLIALAVPLSVVGLGLTAIGPDGWSGMGNLSARPTTIAAVQDHYERSVGNVELDLTALPSTGHVEVEASVDIGNVTVIVPEDADVTLTCKTDKGSLDCLGEDVGGFDQKIKTVDYGADGEGGLEITLDARSDAGNVEVRRG